ncbi:uncharacterized protein LOC120351890 [Nilaparvata lugens]|uniref:uncharacterized protein LOC120349840 n=1 Tax=Nilaparvata lugens TaxID=108931 RepID=UPI00193CDC1E|nr:uncharacterized protein LOC120349840 [Nilaparvata lugens]XP_039279790.1 uncharacterized protein LOC120350455 [Nilaparvata lugens]XP_039280158.1 uncharacterized protein LOC120350515 [Nilaparvata lugens]XP_039283265.1 uncharacterized protein LOC120351139 [Nilaparvata lugens]XP_039284858.1 uncharacterized protein LOC120351457 [Nilaparvata lugens]XP_039286589.1 uncharacterized protein LOC120351890 [Nilaparvata lugens]
MSPSPAVTRANTGLKSENDKATSVAQSPAAKQPKQKKILQQQQQRGNAARPHSSPSCSTADCSAVSLATEQQLAAALEKLLTSDAFVDRLAARLSETVSARVLEDLGGRLQVAENRLVDLNGEMDALRAELAQLKESSDMRLDGLAQYSRRNNIRITGVPEASDEDVTATTVQLLSDKLGVPIQPADIDRCHRVGRLAQPRDNQEPRPRQILVKFISYQKRSSIISNRRQLSGTGFSVQEDLTRKRHLFFREMCGRVGFKNVWSRDGRVFWRDNNRVFSEFSNGPNNNANSDQLGDSHM